MARYAQCYITELAMNIYNITFEISVLPIEAESALTCMTVAHIGR